MIETSFYSLLSQDPGIQAVVSDRIYPVLLTTDGQYPAITWQIVSGHTAPGLTTRGLQRWRVQVDCWGERYLDAAVVRKAVIHALDLRNAQLPDGIWLQGAVLIQPIDFYAGENELFRCGAEFYLYFQFPNA